MIDGFVDLPWSQLAAFMGFVVGTLTAFGMLSLRFQRLSGWMRTMIQDTLGITALKSSFDFYVAKDTGEHVEMRASITELATVVHEYVDERHQLAVDTATAVANAAQEARLAVGSAAKEAVAAVAAAATHAREEVLAAAAAAARETNTPPANGHDTKGTQ